MVTVAADCNTVLRNFAAFVVSTQDALMTPIEQRLERAFFRLQQGQLRPAVKLLRGIVRDAPDYYEAVELLARLALRQRKYEFARDLLEPAVNRWPGSAQLKMSLGGAYLETGQLELAKKLLEEAASLNKRDGLIHFHLGRAQQALGELNDACHSFQRAIHHLPKFTAAYYKLAGTLADAGALNAAAVQYRKVIELEPRRVAAYIDLGNVLRRCDNDRAAETCYQRALELNPNSVGALNNYANLLRDRREFDQALRLMLQATKISPNDPILHNGLGLAYEKRLQFEQAKMCYLRAIELDPRYAKAHYNLAGMQQELGQLEDAERGYLKALESNPEYPENRFRLATLRMLRGDFAAGWADYELRWKMKEAGGKARAFDKPAWDGGSLAGKTILVYAEQGLGDTLQFIRYTQKLKDLGATVVFECHPRLVAFAGRTSGVDLAIPSDEGELPNFDVQVALMSLPGLFKTTVESIPAEVPYLQADPDRVSQWKSRLEQVSGLRVGIAWQGKRTYFRDAGRSIPLENLSPLAKLPSVQLISLQKGEGSEQLKKFSARDQVLNLASELDTGADGFEDTAAVIENLDLVITSDTAVAHLAGGLGAKVWVALGLVPEWRWLLDRIDSPWYPTMRLFRCSSFGDWSGVVANIGRELEQIALR